MNQINAGNAFGYQDLMNQLDGMSIALGNVVTSPPTLGIGTSSAAKVKLTNAAATTGLAGSVPFSKASATEVAFTATAHDIPANAASVQERVYVITCTAAGTMGIVAGTIASGAGNALLPERPVNGVCPIGYVRIAVAAAAPSPGANFVATDATNGLLSNAWLTVTYKDGYPMPLFSKAQ